MWVALLVAIVPGIAVAEEGADQESKSKPDAAELAARLANPADTPSSFSFNWDFVEYQGNLPGAGGQRGHTLSLQPVIPLSLEGGKKFFIRPLIPWLIKQPAFDPASGSFEDKTELGDIGTELAWGGVEKNGLLWLLGGQVTLPTATDDAVGLDQWTLGPEVVVGYTSKHLIVGGIFNHRWSVWGRNDPGTSVTGGQYFVIIPFLDGTWQIQSTPTWSYNHNPKGDENLTFPVGGGISKTLRLGDMTWKFAAQYWHYLQQSDRFGQDQQLRFTITPVIDLPF
jgi:hypothetical protein